MRFLVVVWFPGAMRRDDMKWCVCSKDEGTFILSWNEQRKKLTRRYFSVKPLPLVHFPHAHYWLEICAVCLHYRSVLLPLQSLNACGQVKDKTYEEDEEEVQEEKCVCCWFTSSALPVLELLVWVLTGGAVCRVQRSLSLSAAAAAAVLCSGAHHRIKLILKRMNKSWELIWNQTNPIWNSCRHYCQFSGHFRCVVKCITHVVTPLGEARHRACLCLPLPTSICNRALLEFSRSNLPLTVFMAHNKQMRRY